MIDTQLLDIHYYTLCGYDELNRLEYLNDINECKILHQQELVPCIKSVLQISNNYVSKNRKFKNKLPYYIKINKTSKEFFKIIQIILASNNNIPILMDNPNSIYWNNYIYKSMGRNTRYKCTYRNCNYAIKLDERDNAIYTIDNNNHCPHCFIHNYKLKLVYELMKIELKNNVMMEPSPDTITPKIHYNRILKKYNNKIPLLNLDDFTSFQSIKSSLYKIKRITHTLTSVNIQSFFDDKFEFVLGEYSPSANRRKMIKESLKYNIYNNNVILTRNELLKIFFKALVVGGDGTFSIRPQFILKNGHRAYIHEQVFKLYAYYSYDTLNNETIVKNYLVAIAILDDKKQSTYEWMYGVIFKWCEDLQINCNIKQYICDFEKAQREAFKKVTKIKYNIELGGEEFHYKNALFKNIQTKSLSCYYVNKKQANNKYDEFFRKNIELLYNLLHIPVKKVKQFSIKITCMLWYHVCKKYNTQQRKYFLGFIIYFLYGWGECSKDEIKSHLKLKGCYKTFLEKRKCVRVCNIKDWNVSENIIKNTNSIEVLNKHHKNEMGCHPSIDKFIMACLKLFDDSVRQYNSNNAKLQLPNGYQNKMCKVKKKFLEKPIKSNMEFNEFLIYSQRLTIIKFRSKSKNIERYFDIENINGQNTLNNDIEVYFNNIDNNEINDDLEFCSNDDMYTEHENINFNDETKDVDDDMKQVNKPYTIGNKYELNSIGINNDKQVTENNFILNLPRLDLFDTDIDKDCVSNIPINSRSKKRTCRLQLEKANYNPYVIYSSADEQSIWYNNMKAKHQYDVDKNQREKKNTPTPIYIPSEKLTKHNRSKNKKLKKRKREIKNSETMVSVANKKIKI